MDASRQPLSEALGVPDVYPWLPDCPENQLTPESLLNGYRVSHEKDFRITDKGELELSLCGQQEPWDTSSLAGYKQVVLQQLRQVYRSHKARHKAGVLYDVALASSSLSTAITYPQQHTVGEAARQQWVQDLAGSSPLGSLAGCVPHGFMRGKLFEMLAAQRVALPRAAWFVQVAYLNRTKPESWDGGARLPTRSLQCTEDLLAYLEQAAAAAIAAAPPAPAAAPATAAASPSPVGGPTDAAAPSAGGAAGLEAAGPGARWQYMLRLAGALYCQGLMHAPTLVGWLLGKATLLPVDFQLQLLPLLALLLREVSLSPVLLRQVVDACIKQASPLQPAGGSLARTSSGALALPGIGSPSSGRPSAGSGGSEEGLAALRQGYAEVAAALLALAPMAFTPLDRPTLHALKTMLDGMGARQGAAEEQQAGEERGLVNSAEAAELLEEIEGLQRRLASSVNPRVLRLQDTKAMQMLDSHLATCDAPAVHAALLKALLPPAPSQRAVRKAQAELVRLVCSWAVAHPRAHMALVLGGEAWESAAELHWGWGARLQPGRALLALAVLKHHLQQAQQPQQPAQRPEQAAGRAPGGAASGSGTAGPPLPDVAGAASAACPEEAQEALQGALFSWLATEGEAARCAPGAAAAPAASQLGGSLLQPPAGGGQSSAPAASGDRSLAARLSHLQASRVFEWVVLLAGSGLLSPSAYLRTLLASGVLPGAKQRGGHCPAAAFHLGLLEELHPSLISDPPTTVPFMPQQPRSMSPASGPLLSGQKRKLGSEEPLGVGSEAAGGGRSAASPSPPGPSRAASPADANTGGPAAVQQQQRRERDREQQGPGVRETYAVLRRAVLLEYGQRMGGPVREGALQPGALPAWSGPLSRQGSAALDLEGTSMDLDAGDTIGAPSAATTATTQLTQGPGSSPTAAMQQLKSRMSHLLGLPGGLPFDPSGGLPAQGEASGVQEQLWRDAVSDIHALRAWQRRHLAGWLHSAARQKLRIALPSPTATSSSSIVQAGTPMLEPLWLMNVLGALDACGGHYEAAGVLCDLLAALLRTVALAAVGGIATSQGPQAPSSPGLGEAVHAAQDRFWRHTGLPPFLILRLVAAHHQRLAALGRVPRLLRMLTAGLWTLVPPAAAAQRQQQQQQGAGRPQDPRQWAQQAEQAVLARQDMQQAQQEILSCCHAQLALAGELLALYGAPAPPASSGRTPGSAAYGGRGGGGSTQGAAASGGNSGVQQWMADMEKQHGAQHWMLAALKRLAGEAATRAQPQQAAPARPQPGGAGRGAAAGGRGGHSSVHARSSAPELAASLLESMGAAMKQWQGQQHGSGRVAALGEALGLLRDLDSKAQHTLGAQGPAGGALLGQAWEAAERLAAWVGAPAPSPPAAGVGPTKQLCERAGVAVLAVFLAHGSAAAGMPNPALTDWAAMGAAAAPEAACLGPFRDCLLRLGELLGRRCRPHLPQAFLSAAAVAAAQHAIHGPAMSELAPRASDVLLAAAVSHGLAPLDACLAAAGSSAPATTLLADADHLPGVCPGEAWALASLQRSLPQHAATDALLVVHQASCTPAQQQPTAQDGRREGEESQLLISPAVQEASLSNPRQLYAAITRWEVLQQRGGGPQQQQQQQQQQSKTYPPRAVALWVLTGGGGPGSIGSGDGRAGALDALLAHAIPSALPLCWLVVKGLLDEQAFQAALRRGETVQNAMAAVSQQLASAGNDSHAAPSEAEKDFTSRVLAELAVHPETAAVLCALCSEAGRGVGDYLLQQLDWVLQDADTLLGRQPLSAVLARRGALIATAAFNPPSAAPEAPSVATSTASPAALPAAGPQQQPAEDSATAGGAPAAPALQSQGTDAGPANACAFRVEQGFIEAALVCLAASSEARRRSFAQQLVQQLQRLADTVERLPLPTVAAAAAGGEQAGGAWEAGTPGGQPEAVGAAAAASQQPLGARPGSGRAAGGFGWRGGGSGWGAGARGAQRGKPSPDTAGSVAGIQVGVWLRLGILFPLLPVVYSDTSSDPGNSLRAALLGAITRLLGSPHISAAPPDWPADDPQHQAAAAAAERAGEVLPARMLHMVSALAAGNWASWLQGGRQLRDVPAFEGARQLAATIEGLPAPKRVKLAASAALPGAQPVLATLPSAATQGPPTPAEAPPREVQPPKGAARIDPWLLLPGGSCGSDAQQLLKQASGMGSSGALAPHFLAGAVRVRKRDPLTYSFMGAS